MNWTNGVEVIRIVHDTKTMMGWNTDNVKAVMEQNVPEWPFKNKKVAAKEQSFPLQLFRTAFLAKAQVLMSCFKERGLP